METENLNIQDQLALNRYEMPHVHDGAVVMWYPTGVINKRKRELAWVRSHSQRGVNVYTSTGKRMDAVRHVSDPRLQLNADQRENGAWDFVEDYLFLLDVAKRLEALEKQVTALITDKPKKRGPGRPRKDENVKTAVDNVVSAAQAQTS